MDLKSYLTPVELRALKSVNHSQPISYDLARRLAVSAVIISFASLIVSILALRS